MGDDSLKKFRVGDRQRPQIKRVQAPADGGAKAVRGTAPGSAAQADASDETDLGQLRFARIEEALDHEDPRDLGARLAKMLGDLDAYAEANTTPKARAATRQARQAVERTIDVVDHLYRVRERLAQPAADAEGTSP